MNLVIKLQFAVMVGFAFSLIGCVSPTSSATPTVPSSVALIPPTPDLALISKLSTGLFLEPDPVLRATPVTSPLILRSRLVRLNSDWLVSLIAPQPDPAPSNPRTVPLNLFPDAFYVAAPDRVELNPKGFVWLGHLDGIKSSQVTLVVENDILTGNIRLPGKLYQVQFAGNGLYSVNEVDPKSFPPD